MGQCCSDQQIDTANGPKVIVGSKPAPKGTPSQHPTDSSSNDASLQTSFSFQSTSPQQSITRRTSPSPLSQTKRPDHKVRQEEESEDQILNKIFGYARNFASKYELGPEVGRGHFGYTCSGTVKIGDLRGQKVAIKLIPKAKMTTAVAIMDVQREVKIMRALSGHANVVKFYDVCEDVHNVYIIMELCMGGELLDHLLERGGKYEEEDAKGVAMQMLNAVAFIHLQGVVHRDLKPENFLFSSQDEGSQMKTIDFGLADFVKPDEKLNDIVGSAYYVAPEVLQQSYGTEADIWSIGVIIYMLLSGNRPFWARTESGIFYAVEKEEPSYDEMPWPYITPKAKDFVNRLLNKDSQKRLTAAQALTHPWLRGSHKIPLDIRTLKLVKSYLQSSSLKRSALKALAKTLMGDDFFYFGCQFMLLNPGKDGGISQENFKEALSKCATEAMMESQAWKLLKSMHALSFQKMYFEEFCAAALNVHQLEESERWEEDSRRAYEHFDKKGNRLVSVEELAEEMTHHESTPASIFFHEWVRLEDGKLSFFGFINLLFA